MINLKLAILDMYKGAPNQGMRNIHEIVDGYAEDHGIRLEKKVFDVRRKNECPGLEYDAYISTGGPGSPIDAEGWEEEWKNLMESIIDFNSKSESSKKYVFLICHSFQLMCHHFRLAHVSKRRTESFGIFPMHPTFAGRKNKYTGQLPDPFYAFDSRLYQVVKPDSRALHNMGARILAIEKERTYVPLERATMAIQFTPEIVGTQFHPEADPDGMLYYMRNEEKKQVIINNYGQEKYDRMITRLQDPDMIALTQKKMIPVFLDEVLHVNYKEVLTA